MTNNLTELLEGAIVAQSVTVWQVGGQLHTKRSYALQQLLLHQLNDPDSVDDLAQQICDPRHRKMIRALFDIMDENDIMEKLAP